MLVTSIFSFSYNVLYLFRCYFQFLSHIYFFACKCFQFGPVEIFSAFPTMFSTLPNAIFSFWVTFILSSVDAFNLDQSKNFLLFPQCFQPFPMLFSVFESHLFCCLQMLSIWTSQKFFFFPTMFSTLPNAIFSFWVTFFLSSSNAVNLDQSKIFLLFPQCFQPFPMLFSVFESHFFCRLQMLSIWTSRKFFSFSHNVFNPSQCYFQFLSPNFFVVCKCCQFGPVENFSPFPTMFSTLPDAVFSFWVTFILSSANAFNLDQSKMFLLSHSVPFQCYFQFLSLFFFVVCKCFQFGPVENVSPFPQCSFPMLFSVFESLFFCCLQMLSIWTSRKMFLLSHNVPSQCYFQFLSHFFFVVCKCFQFGPVENVSPFPQCSFPMLFSVFESLFFCRLQMLSIWTSRKCFSFPTMFLPNAIFSFWVTFFLLSANAFNLDQSKMFLLSHNVPSQCYFQFLSHFFFVVCKCFQFGPVENVSPFPQCSFPMLFSVFESLFFCRLQMLSIWTSRKCFSFPTMFLPNAIFSFWVTFFLLSANAFNLDQSKMFLLSHNVPSQCYFQFLSHFFFVVCKCFQFGPVENVSPFPQCSFPMLFSVFESLFFCRLQMLSIWTSRKCFSFPTMFLPNAIFSFWVTFFLLSANAFNLDQSKMFLLSHNVPSQCYFQFLSHFFFVVCKCFQFGPVENVSPFPQCSFPMLFSVFESLFFCRLQMLSIWTSRKCFSFPTMFLPNAIFSFWVTFFLSSANAFNLDQSKMFLLSHNVPSQCYFQFLSHFFFVVCKCFQFGPVENVSPFPQCSFPMLFSVFESLFFCCLQMLSIWTSRKCFSFPTMFLPNAIFSFWVTFFLSSANAFNLDQSKMFLLSHNVPSQCYFQFLSHFFFVVCKCFQFGPVENVSPFPQCSFPMLFSVFESLFFCRLQMLSIWTSRKCFSFPTMFLPNAIFSFWVTFFLSSANAFNLDQSKMFLLSHNVPSQCYFQFLSHFFFVVCKCFQFGPVENVSPFPQCSFPMLFSVFESLFFCRLQMLSIWTSRKCFSFPTMFLPNAIFSFWVTFFLSSANAFNLDQSKMFLLSHNVPSQCYFQFLSHFFFVVCKCFQFGPVENVSPFPQCSFPMLFSVFESLFFCRLQMLSIWTSRKCFSFPTMFLPNAIFSFWVTFFLSSANAFNLDQSKMFLLSHNVPSQCYFQFLSHFFFVVCKCFQFGPVENVSPFPQCSFPMLFSVFESLFFCRLQMLSIWTSRKCFSFPTMFLPNAIFSFWVTFFLLSANAFNLDQSKMFLLSHNVPSQCYFQFLSHFFFVVCKCFQFGPVENVSPFPQCSFPMLFSVFESLFFCRLQMLSIWTSRKCFSFPTMFLPNAIFSFWVTFFLLSANAFNLDQSKMFLLSHNVPSQCYFQFLSHFFFVVCKCFQFGPVENVSPFPQCSFPMLFSVFESLFFCCLQMLSIWTSRKCFSFPTMFLPNAIFSFWVTFFLSSANAFNLDQSKMFLLSHSVPSQCYFQFLSHFFFVVCKCFQFGPVENVSPFPQCSFPMLFSVFESLFFCRLQMLSIWTSRKCFSFPTVFLFQCYFQFLSHFFFVVCKCFQFGPVENVSPFPQCSFPMLFSVFESLFFCRLQMLSIWTSRKCFSFPTVFLPNAIFSFWVTFFLLSANAFNLDQSKMFLLSHSVPFQCYFQFLSHFFFVVCKCFQFGPVENVSPFPQCSFPMLFSVFESLFFCRLLMLSIWTSRKCFSFPTMFLPNAIF